MVVRSFRSPTKMLSNTQSETTKYLTRLKIPVNDSLIVNVLNRLNNAPHDLRSLLISELRPLLLFFLDKLCELTPVHQLHAEEYPVPDFSNLPGTSHINKEWYFFTCLKRMIFSCCRFFRISASCLSNPTSSVLMFFRLIT